MSVVGIGETTVVVTVFLFAVFVIILDTQVGLQQADKSLVEMALSFGARRRQIYAAGAKPGNDHPGAKERMPYLIVKVRRRNDAGHRARRATVRRRTGRRRRCERRGRGSRGSVKPRTFADRLDASKAPRPGLRSEEL